jgi:Na+/proline symporter
MVRFMALNDPQGIVVARAWYYGFFTIFYAMATAVGLLARVYLPELGALDPELALPSMAQMLLPPVLVGLILAGIFAATMSTADSLVLSCSASLAQDLAPRKAHSLFWSKVATLAVTAVALVVALIGPSSVFTLVVLAWSTLGSAFAPLMLVYALQRRVSETLALAMMLTGPAVALLWRYLELHNDIFEGMPGILAGLCVYLVGSRIHTLRVAKAAPRPGPP